MSRSVVCFTGRPFVSTNPPKLSHSIPTYRRPTNLLGLLTLAWCVRGKRLSRRPDNSFRREHKEKLKGTLDRSPSIAYLSRPVSPYGASLSGPPHWQGAS